MNEQSHLEAVLADPGKAGVYHMPNMDKAPVVAAGEANGYSCCRADLAKANDKDDMLAAIAQALHFPDWFGHNFDALADCLGDMSWLPAEGYLVMLEHCDGIHSKAEADFVTTLQIFQQVAEDWRDQGVALWCLVEMQADGIAWLPTGP
jgi:RNAse (barnase) inhibitor barstar